MSDCQCHGPGYCHARRRDVTALGQRICQAGDPRSIAAYFGDGDAAMRAAGASEPRAAAEGERAGPCLFLGELLRDAEGKTVTRACPSCRGSVLQKVYGCGHPGHGGETVLKDCRSCPDYTARAAELVVVEWPAVTAPTSVDPVMNYWRGGSS